MNGINCQLIVCILVVGPINMFKNIIDTNLVRE